MTVTDYGEIVAALRAVPGVADADVEPDAEGGMGLLRLGLAPGFDEVQVATSVGRLLRERFGLGVDAERVQLVEDAQVDRRPDADSARLRRPAIRRMHLVSSGLEITASVTLGVDGRNVVGEAAGTATQSGVQKAVANATLRAIEQIVTGARFELEHLEVAQTGRDRTVLVGVTLVTTTSGAERLTGAAVVREDVRQAVIRATLDACNRRIEMLLG